MGQTIRQKAETMIKENSSQLNDILYHLLWKEHVKEDVEGMIEEGYYFDVPTRSDISNLEEHQRADLVDTVAERYCFDEDYDCETDYWTNLENLVYSVMYGI